VTEVRVTVAVAVKDRRAQMLRCLDALLAQDFGDYEVLVLDNGSTDGTPEACRERAAGSATPVRVETVPGLLGEVRNRGAQLARGELLAFTDSDCIPTPGWLTAAVAPFDGDERLGIVQGATLPEPGEPLTGWAATQEIPELSKRYECCNLVVRRSALLDSPGFDEHGNFGEDTAGAYGLLRGGWGATFAPAALVHHDVTYPGFGWWLRRARLYGTLARIVREYPELRDELLYKRYFLRPRTPKFLAALVGLALAPRFRWAALAAVPYLLETTPRRRNLAAASVTTAKFAIFDLVTLAGNLKGSVKHRTPLI
jgi:glycosyltransferase involved in cell wall biosynthesis